MNRLSVRHIISFVVILVVQVLLLRPVQVQFLDNFSISIIVYPLIILLLPITSRRSVVIAIAFIIGLLIDVFYDSPGVHTAAFVFTGFIRPYALAILEPRLGYRTNEVIEINHYGLNWFMSYIAIMLIIHLFVYFSIDAFSFIFITKIVVNSIASFFASYLLIILYKMLI